jgi:hypothetical protein
VLGGTLLICVERGAATMELALLIAVCLQSVASQERLACCQRGHITHWSPVELQCVQSLARCQRRHITHLSIVEAQCVQRLARCQCRHISTRVLLRFSVCRALQDASAGALADKVYPRDVALAGHHRCFIG